MVGCYSKSRQVKIDHRKEIFFHNYAIHLLIQTVNIAKYTVLNVTKLGKYIGEEIIALNSVSFRDVFIHPSYEVDEEKLRNSLRIILFHILNFL
jgi:hypothetical protein